MEQLKKLLWNKKTLSKASTTQTGKLTEKLAADYLVLQIFIVNTVKLILL